MGLIPTIGFSADQARASIATGFASKYAGTLTPDLQQVIDALATAVSETMEKNNKKVGDDLSAQVSKYLGGFGRLR